MKKIILSLVMAASAALASPSVIPQPLEMKATGKTYELKSTAVIAYADGAAKPSAEWLAAQLRPVTGYKLPVTKGGKGDIVFQILEDQALGKEG